MSDDHLALVSPSQPGTQIVLMGWYHASPPPLLNIRCIQTSRDIILVLAPNSLLVYFASASNPLYSIKQLPKKFCCKPINAGYS